MLRVKGIQTIWKKLQKHAKWKPVILSSSVLILWKRTTSTQKDTTS